MRSRSVSTSFGASQRDSIQETSAALLYRVYDLPSSLVLLLTAGYRVGYDDGSHFNREYKRVFGAPPMRDVTRLRDAATASTGL